MEWIDNASLLDDYRLAKILSFKGIANATLIIG
jgi:hypothetical protein